MSVLVQRLDDDREGRDVSCGQCDTGEGVCEKSDSPALAVEILPHTKASDDGGGDLPVSELPGYAAWEGITVNRSHTEGVVADDSPRGGLNQDVRDRHPSTMVVGSPLPEITIQLWHTAREGVEIVLLLVEYLGVVITVRHRA